MIFKKSQASRFYYGILSCLAFAALRKFFVSEDSNRSDVIGPIIERLYYFTHWMERQKLFKLFATSLLIVYEGDTSRPIRKPRDLLDIRLVDFAHAYERNPGDFNEPDYNTLFGLQNLIKYLEQLSMDDNSSCSLGQSSSRDQPLL